MAEHNGTKAILKLRFNIFTLHMNYDMLGYSEEFKRKRETNGGLVLKVFHYGWSFPKKMPKTILSTSHLKKRCSDSDLAPFFGNFNLSSIKPPLGRIQLKLYKFFGPIVKIWNGRFLMMIWCTDWYLSLLLAQLNESNLFSVSVSCQIQLLQRVSRKSMDFLLTI